MDNIHKIKMIDPRYRSAYFRHVFEDEHYPAGYSVYIWAEVLDADGFEAFREKVFLIRRLPGHSGQTFLRKAVPSNRWWRTKSFEDVNLT